MSSSSSSESSDSDFSLESLGDGPKSTQKGKRQLKNASIINKRKPRQKIKIRKSTFSTSFTKKVANNNSNLAKHLSKLKMQHQTLQSELNQVKNAKMELAMLYNTDTLCFQDYISKIEASVKEGGQEIRGVIDKFMTIQSSIDEAKNCISKIDASVKEGVQEFRGVVDKFLTIQSSIDEVKGRTSFQLPVPPELPKSQTRGSTSSKTQSVCPMVSGHTIFRPKLTLTRITIPEQAVELPATPPSPVVEDVETLGTSSNDRGLLPEVNLPTLDEGDDSEDDDEEQESLLCRNKRVKCFPNSGATVSQHRESMKAFYDRVNAEDAMEGPSHRPARSGLRTKHAAVHYSEQPSTDEDEPVNRTYVIGVDNPLNRTSLVVEDMEETIANMSPIKKDNLNSISSTINEPKVLENHINGLLIVQSHEKNYSQPAPITKPGRLARPRGPIRLSILSKPIKSCCSSSIMSQETVHNEAQSLFEQPINNGISSQNPEATGPVTPNNVTSVPDNVLPCTESLSTPNVLLPTSSAKDTAVCQNVTNKKLSVLLPLEKSSAICEADGGPLLSLSPESTKTFGEMSKSPLEKDRKLVVACNRLPMDAKAQMRLNLSKREMLPTKRTPEIQIGMNCANESKIIQSASAAEMRSLLVTLDRLPMSDPLTHQKKNSNGIETNKTPIRKRKAVSSETGNTPSRLKADRLKAVRAPNSFVVNEDQLENKTSFQTKQATLVGERKTRSALGKISPHNYKEASLNMKMRRVDTATGSTVETKTKTGDRQTSGESTP